MKFKIGDRVRYVSGNYEDAPSNPLWGGTEGFVEGEVNYTTAHDIHVTWDNGRSNIYEERDLLFFNELSAANSAESIKLKIGDRVAIGRNKGVVDAIVSSNAGRDKYYIKWDHTGKTGSYAYVVQQLEIIKKKKFNHPHTKIFV